MYKRLVLGITLIVLISAVLTPTIPRFTSSYSPKDITIKVLHGIPMNKSNDDNGMYYIIFSIDSLEYDLGSWLIYNAITKSESWWRKYFSVDAVKAALYVKVVYSHKKVVVDGIKYELKDIPYYVIENRTRLSLDKWYGFELFRTTIGSCIPRGYIKIYVKNREYALYISASRRCLDQYLKIYSLGGWYDITILWVSNRYVIEEKDIVTVPGWNIIIDINSSFTRKLLKVLSIAESILGETNIELTVLAAGYGVGGKPVFKAIPDYQWYPGLEGTNVSQILETLGRSHPFITIESASLTIGKIIVNLEHLVEVVKALRTINLRMGLLVYRTVSSP